MSDSASDQNLPDLANSASPVSLESPEIVEPSAPLDMPSISAEAVVALQRMRAQAEKEVRAKMREVWAQCRGDDVPFTFKDEVIFVPAPTFYDLKRCWGAVGKASVSVDPIDRLDAVLEVVSVSLEATDHPKTTDELAKKFTGRQWQGLTASYSVLIIKAGLLPETVMDDPPSITEGSNMGEAGTGAGTGTGTEVGPKEGGLKPLSREGQQGFVTSLDHNSGSRSSASPRQVFQGNEPVSLELYERPTSIQ